ncbi:MAG: winged helix-turn-helix domain-containing protein [Bacillota bacterium]|nr:winged helix-turn-helix domain-containing protein [Bacillota bacterium]
MGNKSSNPYFGLVAEKEMSYAGTKFANQNPYYETHGLKIIPCSLTVEYGDKSTKLTKNSMILLEILIMDPTIIHSRENICNILSDCASPLSENALNQCVHRLKEKLKELLDEELIDTERGVGYRWKYEVKCFYR